MTHFAYLFEGKGLQAFLGESGRLIDLIGGSNLIASLAQSNEDDELAAVLAGMEALEPSRRAGGALCLHAEDRDALVRFRAAWRLRVGMVAPGLAFSDVLTDGHSSPMDALNAAYGSQSGLRENGAATLLPFAPPDTKLDPRTARPAVTVDRESEDEDTDTVVDLVRNAGRAISRGPAATDPVSRRFLDAEEMERFVFPRHFDLKDAVARNPAFPFLASPHRIGVVHADLSGLAQLFRGVVNAARDIETVRSVATAIEEAIEAAARDAMCDVVLPEAIPRNADKEDQALHIKLFGGKLPPHARRVPPARPVLLGGDDLTVILRADLALPFAAAFLAALETHSEGTLRALKEAGRPVAAEVLTACAGVALVGKGHPYTMAAHLADSMCDQAKSIVKAKAAAVPASAITFAAVESAIGDDYAAFRARELTAPSDASLTQCPYVVGRFECAGAPHLSDILAIARILADIRGRGKIFEAFDETTSDATQAYRRFWRVLSIDNQSAHNALVDRLSKLAGPRAPEPEGEDSKAETERRAYWDACRQREMGFLADALEIVDTGCLGNPADPASDMVEETGT